MSVTRILVADDDDLVCRTVARVLRKDGSEVTCVGTLEEALTALRDGNFDLVVTDIALGADSGVELAWAAARMHPSPSVVAMSGRSGPTVGLELGKAGVAAFLEKPFVPAALIEVVAGLEPPKEDELDAVVARVVGARTMPEVLDAVRRSMVNEALAQKNNNKAQAAGLLGISRQNLQNILSRGLA